MKSIITIFTTNWSHCPPPLPLPITIYNTIMKKVNIPSLYIVYNNHKLISLPPIPLLITIYNTIMEKVNIPSLDIVYKFVHSNFPMRCPNFSQEAFKQKLNVVMSKKFYFKLKML